MKIKERKVKKERNPSKDTTSTTKQGFPFVLGFFSWYSYPESGLTKNPGFRFSVTDAV
jgi:hypothetical protein